MAATKAEGRDGLLKGSPAKGLFLFAVPLILGNLFQQFYNMTDSIIVGNFVGEDALAAVGASYALTNVFIMIAIGGGNGASVLTSQYLGAKQYSRMKTSISTSCLTFLILSIFLGAFGFFFSGPILRALDTPENILEQALVYIRIYLLSMLPLFLYNMNAGIIRARGDSRTPMLFQLLGAASQLDLFFQMNLVFRSQVQVPDLLDDFTHLAAAGFPILLLGQQLFIFFGELQVIMISLPVVLHGKISLGVVV